MNGDASDLGARCCSSVTTMQNECGRSDKVTIKVRVPSYYRHEQFHWGVLTLK